VTSVAPNNSIAITAQPLNVPDSFHFGPPVQEEQPQKHNVVRYGVGPTIAITVIVLGLVARYVTGSLDLARLIWLMGLIGTGAPVVWRTMRGAWHGNFNADVVATLSIVTAAAINQPLAGMVIVLMQTGGEALEKFAEGRASLALRDLEKSAPQIAHLVSEIRGVVDVPARSLQVNDQFLLRPGDLVPCDGLVVDGESEIDTSQLTGEALPLRAHAGTKVLSGMLNLHGVLTVRATAQAADSQYARIVQLVRAALASKSPLQRVADRYAVWFTPVTVALCAITFVLSRSWVHVLSVLVVATPCPLILATPVAMIGGINRAARAKVIIRNSAALESLSAAETAVFDKTGTLTVGKPAVHRVVALPGFSEDEVFRLAAAVENGSSHLLARVIVDQAKTTYPAIPSATQHIESPGEGVTGVVEGIDVAIGGRAFVARHCTTSLEPFSALEGSTPVLRAYVLLRGIPAGVIEFADSLRPELLQSLDRLRDLGFRRRVLLSGDSIANTNAVARLAGMNEVHGELLPVEKAALVSRYRAAGETVMMVGDGTNDAPALSTANVGVALSGHGGGVTAEAADVVILADDLMKLPQAITISRRTMRLARQSIGVGLGLSGVAMVFAAFGFIPPTQGAILQEAIDVAVIINALRASWS
jgi:heavy metal translocating P-type ATPase